MPERLFIFIQLEFPWVLGPPDGRYLLRDRPDGDPRHVVVVSTLGASRAAIGAVPGVGRRPSLMRRRRLFSHRLCDKMGVMRGGTQRHNDTS